MIFIIRSDFLTMVGGVALNGAFLGGRALASLRKSFALGSGSSLFGARPSHRGCSVRAFSEMRLRCLGCLGECGLLYSLLSGIFDPIPKSVLLSGHVPWDRSKDSPLELYLV